MGSKQKSHAISEQNSKTSKLIENYNHSKICSHKHTYMRAVIIHRLSEGNDWLSQNLSDLQKAIERRRESSRALMLVK